MKQYVVDAFTDQIFGGNPAAVCLLDSWLPDELLMKITRENNLSETAFAVPEGSNYHLHWFTPGGEIDLCGHATLATAYVIFRFAQPERSKVSFRTLGGLLTVERRGELLEMDFPAYSLEQVPVKLWAVPAPLLPTWVGTFCAYLTAKKRYGKWQSTRKRCVHCPDCCCTLQQKAATLTASAAPLPPSVPCRKTQSAAADIAT